MSGRKKKKKQRSQPVPEIEGPALTPAASSSPPGPHRWAPRGCPLVALPDVSWGSPTQERVQVSEPVWGRGGQMLSNQPRAPRALPRGQGPGGPSPLSSRHVLSAWSQDRAQKGRPWPENLPPGKTAPWGLPRGSPEVPKAPCRGWGSSSGGLPLDQSSPLQPVCPQCPPSPTPGCPHVA